MNNLQSHPLRNTMLANAIRAIGIGKHGSKPLPIDWFEDCKAEFISPTVNHAQAGAFFGALSVKSKHTTEELALLAFCNEQLTVGATAFQLKSSALISIPTELTELTNKLLGKSNLSKSETVTLGNYIFSDDKTFDFIRGITASIMRVRYETDEELEGLYDVLKTNYSNGLKSISTNLNKLKVQLAEPFDGTEHSPIITPLLATFLVENNYQPIIITGQNPGPKFNLNLFELINHLKVKDNFNITTIGETIDCSELSSGWGYWLNIRFATIKRPFLSTIEKIFNPLNADVLISSVYHITYQEKMVLLSFMAGFKGAIVMKRGLEGSLTPNTSKDCGILCAVKKKNGEILKATFDMSHQDMQAYVNGDVKAKTLIVENITMEENTNWIINFNENKKSGNTDFDNYANAAQKLYRLGLNWLKENW